MRRLWRLVLLVQACSGFIVMPWLPGSAAEPPAGTPELRLSLHEAIQAAIDNNANVRLLKERIVAAQSAARRVLGALLPNVSGFMSGAIKRSISPPSDFLPTDFPAWDCRDP
ncbi:MAG: hypothetical protein IPM88_20770 [Nitrospira sp.]|nr:hypothetical protein [Nitrospira sp.]